MDNHHALSMLLKSLEFKNLTAASQHVGLSQPQLSRLIAQLEQEFGIEVLDRRVKRKASWTPQAFKLAELYEQNQRKFNESIRALQIDYLPRELSIGSLEGLVDIAVQWAPKILDNTSVEVLTIDVYDRADLEAKFLSGDLELILNSRTPGLQQINFIKTLGFQSVSRFDQKSEYNIFSQFEFLSAGRKTSARLSQRKTSQQKQAQNTSKKNLVSNSLAVRRRFFSENGGRAFFPSSVHQNFCEGDDEVLLLGANSLNRNLWQELISFLS